MKIAWNFFFKLNLHFLINSFKFTVNKIKFNYLFFFWLSGCVNLFYNKKIIKIKKKLVDDFFSVILE